MLTVRRFPVDARSIASVRHFVRNLLHGLDVDDGAAELLASELATNAVEHAQTPFTVSVDVDSTVVRVAVEDHAPEFLVAVTERPSERGGFGLRLVETLSHRWGIEATDSKKVVWFELLLFDA